MITRRTLDGALKWAFLDFLREEWRSGCAQLAILRQPMEGLDPLLLIFVMLTVCCEAFVACLR